MPHGRRREWPKLVNERHRAGSPEPRQSAREPRYGAITGRTAFFVLQGPFRPEQLLDVLQRGDRAWKRGSKRMM